MSKPERLPSLESVAALVAASRAEGAGRAGQPAPPLAKAVMAGSRATIRHLAIGGPRSVCGSEPRE